MNITAGDYWLLLAQSDTETKFIFLIFGLMSFSCAVIVAMKLISLRSKNRIARNVLKKLRKAKTIEDVLQITSKYEPTVIGTLLGQYLAALKQLAGQDMFSLSDSDHSQLQDVLDQTVEEIVFQEEAYMPVVSTSAAVAPLIGLLGTVSGLIHAFIQIAQEKTADIVAIAPGIAKALITTWGGLIIAIIFLALFYVVEGRIKAFDHYLMQISDRLMWFGRNILG